ncbi:uncharacterized protein LTHEOB_4711 [Lasiodiplodia theobromae]|uniref:uncharacterized protein n=1 Tax=Lasiodiplodia theobromae TaxID=45133 RepID=UPI0015C3CD5D|nr:uncharacterized protein LTHEOB_4711 [Lasiodiplodia theobromae]KAF4546059.1 hypothetical protein LTHEOB_4711 [Lasiodiplodia theobromae]
MAQHDDLGQNVVNGNKVIIEEMKKLVIDLGFPGSEDVVNPWDRFLFRWRWYLYKPKMTALRQELDSIKTSMTLFVCMVDLEKKMNDPTDRISEACITLEEQIFELKKLLKLQKKEIRKTRERLDYVDEKRMPALTVDRQIWDLANEQHRRLEPLRRQRRIEQLGPLQSRWPNDSGTSFTSQGDTKPKDPSGPND